jgi:hypothetical protein
MDVLKNLGYNEQNIKMLQPNALDLIVADKVVKPRSGIPSRWTIISKNQNDSNDNDTRVRILDYMPSQQRSPFRTIIQTANKKQQQQR